MILRLALVAILVAGCVAPAAGANAPCTFTGHYESNPPNPATVTYEGHGWVPGETVAYSANPPGSAGPFIDGDTETDDTGAFAVGVRVTEPGTYYMRARAADCDLTASVVVPAQPTPAPTVPPTPRVTLPPTDTQ